MSERSRSLPPPAIGRREFLGLAVLAGVTAAGCDDDGPRGARGDPGDPRGGVGASGRQLRIPPLVQPAVGADGVRRFTLTMQAGRTELLPGRPAPTWGVNGTYLGPTLRVTRGDQVAMSVTNRLDEASTLHWHGMRLPAVMDGGPHQMVAPGATWNPHWTIDQPAATGWYHPHPHGSTALHTYRGVSGLLVIDDAETPNLRIPNHYGVDDVPLIVQDKLFHDDGTLNERPPPGLDTTFGLLGDRVLVNGTADPVLAVGTTRVRFRILNASNARVYHVGFADRRTFHAIATDGGLLPAPVPVDRVPLSPAERVEIVVEFAPGEQVVMRSYAGEGGTDEDDFDLLTVFAAGSLEPSPLLPARLVDPPSVQPPAGARVRTFELSGVSHINGKELDMSRVDEVVPAGALEIWKVEGNGRGHNFHIHEVDFRILDIGGQPPPPWLRGPKDTVFIPEDTTIRLAVQFGRYVDPRAPYMFHCHILFHEDKGMMGQYVVVAPGTEDQTPRTIPGVGGHHG